ncbi:unnamed protein product [Soboliphyme baturini]|uniref:Coiled-coil domain-containing protein 130 n=1 Tax=Soboliphyme baturini TaxID=241478 RepID=A0A183IKU4_9BILA|nr:unnamed protein product [Soboliphyme baturini]
MITDVARTALRTKLNADVAYHLTEAERKAVNKYYPPDYDPKKGGLNKWQGTHALRERARKIHLGILIIRFEMPFNVWCEGCSNHVGMGVRYNAEKKKVGMYYTTPIYEFRMKCHLCPNHFVIRTDPKKFDYELVSGLRRQERRWDMTENEQVASTEGATARKLATDAMFKLEHGELDLAKLKAVEPQVERLEKLQQRWKDDFSRNQELRKIFRVSTEENLRSRLNELDRESVFSVASGSKQRSRTLSNSLPTKQNALEELRKSVLYSKEQKLMVQLDQDLDNTIDELKKSIKHDEPTCAQSSGCDQSELKDDENSSVSAESESVSISNLSSVDRPVQTDMHNGLSILRTYCGSSSGSELSDIT